MKKVSLLVAAATLGALVFASSAFGVYNVTSKANGFKAYFVPAYNECTAPAGLRHKPGLNNFGCPPVASTNTTPANKTTVGVKGTASVQLTATKTDIKIKGAGKVILNNGVPYTGAAVKGTSQIRATDNGCEPSPGDDGLPPFDLDCTQVDFPFNVTIPCAAGSCSVSTTANAVQTGAIVALDEENIELGRVELLDPDGDPAGAQGLAVH